MAASDTNFIDALRKKIREHMNEHADHLSGGGNGAPSCFSISLRY